MHATQFALYALSRGHVVMPFAEKPDDINHKANIAMDFVAIC